MEESEPKGEERVATKITFAKGNKDRDLLDRMQPQIMRPNIVESEEATKEVQSGEGETSAYEAQKNHELTGTWHWHSLDGEDLPAI
jgi:hypothetical protein